MTEVRRESVESWQPPTAASGMEDFREVGLTNISNVSALKFDYDVTVTEVMMEPPSRSGAIPDGTVAIEEMQPQLVAEDRIMENPTPAQYAGTTTDKLVAAVASPGIENHSQQQDVTPKQSEPPGFSDFVDPATRHKQPKKGNGGDDKENQDDDEEDDDDDDDIHHDEMITFPRKGKRPKRPKRDQQDIPKVLFQGGVRQQSVKNTTPAEQPRQQPTKLTVETAAESDIPKLLFEGLASLETDEVEQALEILSQTFLLSPSKCTEAVDLGAHGICVLTLKKWKYHKRVQQLSCECIHNIVYNYKDGRIDIMEALAVMGALEAIINSMDKFAESLGIQRFGLAALGNLLYGKGKVLHARARKCVEALDGITTVVSATRRFPKNAMVQGCGCIVLTGFFKLGDYKQTMAEAGVLLDIANAVTNHPTNAVIEKEASTFMKLFFGWNSGSSSSKKIFK